MRGKPAAEALISMRKKDPAEFARIVRSAVERAGGNLTHAAVQLNVGRRTMYNWVDADCHACGGAKHLHGVTCQTCHGAGRVLPA